MVDFSNDQQQDILDALKEEREAERLDRKLKRLHNLEETVKKQPLEDGTIIASAHKICKVSDKLVTNKFCDKMRDRAVEGTMPVKSFITAMLNLCKPDPEARKVLKSIRDMHKEKHPDEY